MESSGAHRSVPEKERPLARNDQTLAERALESLGPSRYLDEMPIDDRERERRRRLMHAHIAAENAHDLDAIVKTFSPKALDPDTGGTLAPDKIRAAHAYLGFSATDPGALEGLAVVPEREHFTDDEIVVEGKVVGVHVREFLGFPPSRARVSLPYCCAYEFDDDDLLVAERLVLDVSPFSAGYASQTDGGQAGETP